MGWVGLILTIIMGLAGIPLIRDWVCAWCKIDERRFSIIRIVLVCVGAIIAGTALYQKSQEVSDLQTELADTAGVALQAQKALEAKQRAEAEAEEKRKTPPILLADLKAIAPQTWYVSIKSENLIPFEFKYRVDTTNDLLVSPWMLEHIKIFPTEQDQLFHRRVNIDWERIKDRYVELKFTFRSLVPELFNEVGHRGSINKKYRVSDNGGLIPIE